MTLFGFLAFVVGLAVVGVIAGAIFHKGFRQTLGILIGRGNNKLTTAIERELALIRAQEKVVENGRNTASDLKGKLQTQRDKLARMRTAEAALVEDVRLAKSLATTRIKAATPDISAEDLKAALTADQIVFGQLQLLANKREEVRIQVQTVAQMEDTSKKTSEAVAEAVQKLTELQLQVKSDEAKAEATNALRGAAEVVSSFKGLNAAGAELDRTRTQVEDEFNGANARFDDAMGDPAQREFEKQKRQNKLGDLLDEV